MTEEKNIVDIWQEQPLAESEIDMAVIMKKAHQFQRKVRFRNLTEYVAAAAVVAWTGHTALTSPAPWLVKTGSVLIGLGAIAVATFLHLRGHAARAEPPLTAPTREVVGWHRSELVRQRDLLRSVPRWYLGPFVPGLALTLVGVWQASPGGAWRVGLGAAFIALVFAGVAWLNSRGARKLDEQIEELGHGLER